ncbi:MAG: HNH endonuclease family protein [Patescibacteria group bacterium]|nr:HNH endonuclease family protein [Patescibacteria group bacterium]
MWGKILHTSHITIPTGKQFEIEHIWANKFEQHTDEFDQENEFSAWRNSIGALVLLPQGTNQSFSSDRYEDKLAHYLKENTYVQTLHPSFYEKNPTFVNSAIIQSWVLNPMSTLPNKISSIGKDWYSAFVKNCGQRSIFLRIC